MLERDGETLRAILTYIQDAGEKYCFKDFIRAEGGKPFSDVGIDSTRRGLFENRSADPTFDFLVFFRRE